MADSVFKDLENAPPIQVFQLTKLFNESTDPNKVNLGVGAYRTEEGKPWVLPVVQTAELQMANDRTLNHEYLPVGGMPDFRIAATRLLLGSNHRVISENRAEGFQACGGTGALRLAAAFLRNVMKYDVCYVSDPTWGNHKGVFKSAGFKEIREYRYWNNDTRDVNFTGMIEDLKAAPPNAVIILHAVAHNPTGVDLNREQWQQVYNVCKEQKLFVLLDCAYQGFASGNLEEDGWASRFFADQDLDFFIAQSFSKNFGLYNERTGNLIVIAKNSTKMPEIRSQMESQIRTIWSNPPNHGARIVTTVLNNKAYFEDWKGQVLSMAERIKKMRQELYDNLKKLGTPGDWNHIIRQIGMFSYTGLTEKQVEYMKSKHIYLLSSGRISMCGLTSKNVAYVAKCMDEAIRAHPNSSTFFVEFAKQKLEEADYNVIKTSVVIDGEMRSEDLQKGKSEVEENGEVESFIKIQLKGSLSSTSTPQLTKREEAEHEEAEDQGVVSEIEDELKQTGTEAEAISTKTQPGTPRSSVKTFKTRSIQTLQGGKLEEFLTPRTVPARFEGTMLTPVFFEGIMLTPQRLDYMLSEAAKKGQTLSVPVKFQGGMLTAAFRTMAENLVRGAETDPVPVKFHGRLQGIMESLTEDNERNPGLPVAFDGKMIQQKGGKGKVKAETES